MSPYALRIALASFALAVATAVLIWRGPQLGDVLVIAQSPGGSDVATGATISLTFSRPVDRLSAEEQIELVPPVEGRFVWQGNSLSFTPSRPLAPGTRYRVLVRAGLRDAQGRANLSETGWSFQTRGPTLLLLAALPDGGSTLALAPLGGEARVAARLPDEALAVSLAPDQAQAVVVVSRGLRTALVLVSLADGSARPLVDDAEASAADPAWSPLGDLIAYVRRPLRGEALGQPRVWLAQPDGTSLGPLLRDESPGFAPVWSPDGGRVAFVSGPAADLGVYSFFDDSRRVLPAGTGEPPAWAPEGTALVYAATSAGEPAAALRIRRADLRAEGAADLTDGSARDRSPAWSPDGRRIAFVRQEADGLGSGIWTMAPDGADQRRLSAGGQNLAPAWSPDGRLLAFLRAESDGTFSVWVVDAAGGEPRLVQSGVAQALWLS